MQQTPTHRQKTLFRAQANRAGAQTVASPDNGFGRLAAMAAVALAASISPAAAQGLGDLTVTSRLGEPFRAFVPLIGAKRAGLDSECIKLVPNPPGGDEPPWLARATFRVERKQGMGRLRIASAEAVTAPILMVGLSVGCGAELRRDYAVFLAPPVPAATESTPPATPRRGAAAPTGERRQAQKGPSAQSAGDGAQEVHPLLRTLQTEEPLGGKFANAAASPRVPSASNLARPESEAAPGRLPRTEFEPPAAHAGLTAEPVAVADKIRQMENTLATLRDAVRKTETAIANATPDFAPGVAVATQPLAQPAAAPSAPRPADTDSTLTLWILAGLASVAALLAAIWRRGRYWREETLGHGHHGQQPEAPKTGLVIRFPLSQEEPRAETAVPIPAAAPSLDAAEDHRIDVAEHHSALELAEILLSFGRLEGAAQILADHINANPKQTVRPWLRLLEVYREGGMRMEFEALARRLNQTFNIEVMAWDQKPRWRGHDCLENYPHIVARLVESWHTPACQDYLRHLLQDNRDGTRSGFSAEVLEDILLLANLLERKAEAPAPAAGAGIQRLPAIRREAPAAAAVPATPDAAVPIEPRPATQPLVHLLARKRHRLAQHPHVPNVVG